MSSQEYHEPVADPSLMSARAATCCSGFPSLRRGGSARCPRCDKELWRRRVDSLNRTLALTLAAAVLYTIANSVPMLGLTVVRARPGGKLLTVKVFVRAPYDQVDRHRHRELERLRAQVRDLTAARGKVLGTSSGVNLENVRRRLIDSLMAHGVRAQLRTGNLLTGAVYVALDVFPGSPPVTHSALSEKLVDFLGICW